MLTGRTLDRVIAKFLRLSVRDLYSEILQDSVLRGKLYACDDTNDIFTRTLKYASKDRKSYLKEFLSYSDLAKKVRHLDFISIESDEDKALFEAIADQRKRKIKRLLDKVSVEAINKAFRKLLIVRKRVDLCLDIARTFLNHQVVKNALSQETLDKVMIRLIELCERNFYSEILQDDVLRKKVYQCAKTRESFDRVLRRVWKKRQWALRELLAYPDLMKRVKHLDFIPQELLDEVRDDSSSEEELDDQDGYDGPITTDEDDSEQEEQELEEEVVSEEDETVALFDEKFTFKQFLKKVLQGASGEIDELDVEMIRTFIETKKTINEDELNRVFLWCVCKERVAIAKMLLTHQVIQEKLKGDSLDLALMKSVKHSLKDFFEAMLSEEQIRKKLYTHKRTKNKIEQFLEITSIMNPRYFDVFLSYFILFLFYFFYLSFIFSPYFIVIYICNSRL